MTRSRSGFGLRRGRNAKLSHFPSPWPMHRQRMITTRIASNSSLECRQRFCTRLMAVSSNVDVGVDVNERRTKRNNHKQLCSAAESCLREANASSSHPPT